MVEKWKGLNKVEKKLKNAIGLGGVSIPKNNTPGWETDLQGDMSDQGEKGTYEV